ncbi:extracellular solute-binding protein [Natrinema caseinilyticum]|uniref:extracellular solute-binding protein n=1 Tax=Natrinema caseinilyticum TaxID=2961570 RepID=UPI0020C2094F|nr:extracellular solute-binding protein [Natrinema caseinilyticum]
MGSGSDSSGPLRVATWSGPYTDRFRNKIKKPYEEETGNKIQCIPGYSEILSKIQSAPEDNPPYDLAVADDYFYFQGTQSGLFAEVDHDNIPNYDDVFPVLKEIRSDGHKYGVPVEGNPNAIAYSDDLESPPTKFAHFAESNRNLKISLSDGFYIYPLQTGAIVADDVEGTGELYDEQYHDAPFNAIGEMNVTKWFTSGAQIWELFRNDIINTAQYYWATAAYQARTNDSLNLNVVVPDVTGGYFDDYCLVRGSDKKEQAEEFLNFLLRADIQTKWSETSWEIKSNKNAEYPEFVAETIPTTNEELKGLQLPDWGYLSDYNSDFSERMKTLKTDQTGN